jgi:hypothetical protein
MAESKGFEPLRQGYPPTRFPIVLLRPLGQLSIMAPQVGLEPTTDRLTADSSTTELLRNNTMPGNVLLSQGLASQLPSALRSLTSVFGMGTGVTFSPLLPDYLFDTILL